MRIVVLAAMLALTALVRPAYAFEFLDCFKAATANSEDKIHICTRLINTGRWKGKDLATLLGNRALGYLKDGNYEDSMTDLDRALALVPNYNYALDQRGEVWRLKGEYDKAIVDFNAAIRADPDFLAAYLDRATAFKNMGNRKSARADYQAVIDLPGKDRAIDRWAKDRARKLLDELGKDD